jgi:hypothetical protein
MLDIGELRYRELKSGVELLFASDAVESVLTGFHVPEHTRCFHTGGAGASLLA